MTLYYCKMQLPIVSRDGRECCSRMHSRWETLRHFHVPYWNCCNTCYPNSRNWPVLASLVADKGAQYVRNMVLGSDSSHTTEDMQVDGVQDSDDDDDDEEEEQHVRAPAVSTGVQRKAAASALSRSQLQTTPKLDRLYQELVLRQQRNVIRMLQSQSVSYRQEMVNLAIYIGNATFWKRWGLTILNSPTR